MNRSTKRFVFFLRVIYFILTYVYVSSCCFCQRTYVAQGYLDGPPSSSLIGCLIHMTLCHICSLTKATTGNIHICN